MASSRARTRHFYTPWHCSASAAGDSSLLAVQPFAMSLRGTQRRPPRPLPQRSCGLRCAVSSATRAPSSASCPPHVARGLRPSPMIGASSSGRRQPSRVVDDDDDQVERMQRTCTEPVSEVRSVAAWFAHGARVWDAAFIGGDTTAAATGDTTSKPLLLASSGEDCLVKLWRVALATAGRQEAEVTLLSTLRGHSGKHVWCVTSIGANGVASGGADGAVKLWPLPQSAVAEPTTITAAAASGSSSAAVPASMVSLPPEETGAIRALDILETVGCAFAATASGSVWALPLGDEQPPQRLYKEDGNRWSVVHATILDGDSNMKKHSNLKHSNMKNVIVLLGSASGDARFCRSKNGHSGKWTVYPATQWRAHKTCIMQFAWATPTSPKLRAISQARTQQAS